MRESLSARTGDCQSNTAGRRRRLGKRGRLGQHPGGLWDWGHGGTALSKTLPHDDPDYEFPKEVHNMLCAANAAHVQLSAMADTKASILMGATFVVFTLTIGQMSSQTLLASPSLIILGVFSFVATVLSVMAVMPKIKTPKGRHPNYLFFGVFSTISDKEFSDMLIDTMRNEEATYRMMIRDLYQNGMVLQKKKYYYLTRAYQAFLAGIILTLFAFMVQAATGWPAPPVAPAVQTIGGSSK
jgi:hypothetical protein